MHAILLAAIVFLFVGEQIDAPLVPAIERYAWLLGAGGQVVVVVALWALSTSQMRRLNRDGQLKRVRRVERAADITRWLALLVHIIAVLGFGMLQQVRAWIGDLVVLDELIALMPFMLALVGIEFAVYPIERRLRDAVMLRSLDQGGAVHPFPGRARFVWLWTRHNILFILIPLLILLAWAETAPMLVPEEKVDTPVGSAVLIGLQVVGIAGVFALVPPLLVRIWDTVPLGPGVLRDSLLSMCRAHGVRVRSVLVWRTGGLMLNGAAIGLVPPLRYIVLTDGLLEQLPGPEVQAVAAHEVGHLRCRHLIWLALSVLGTVLLAGTALGWLILGVEAIGLVEPGSGGESTLVGVGLVLTLLATVTVMGMVSRRFEQQADAFAVRHLSGMARGGEPVVITQAAGLAMAGALERVSCVHGVDPARWTFRHGSIASRQRAIMRAIGKRSDGLPADKAAWRARLAVGLILVAGIALAVVDALVNGLAVSS